jgi:hypothetical protein
MAYDLTGLLTEFYARGFDYLAADAAGVTRATRWVNDAMHAIDEYANWPYLEATTTGNSPLTIADLRVPDVVFDTTNQQVLSQRSSGELAQWAGDLSTTGAPNSYYVSSGTTINVYPANVVSLSVRYWKFGPDLSATTDEPLMPDRFRSAIVDYAVAAALRDDESPDAIVAQSAGDLTVARMKDWASSLAPEYTLTALVGDDS